jgi:hypothetical protein
MKRRLTFLAAAVVLVDVLALGAVWHVSPTLSLTVGLAVPEAEQILSPLYPDPVREDVAGGELHRPARPRSTLILTGDRGSEMDVRAVARALARRDIAVLVPGSTAALAATIAHARTLGVPVRVESVALFRDAEARSTIAGRTAYAWRLLRLSHSLLTAR